MLSVRVFQKNKNFELHERTPWGNQLFATKQEICSPTAIIGIVPIKKNAREKMMKLDFFFVKKLIWVQSLWFVCWGCSFVAMMKLDRNRSRKNKQNRNATAKLTLRYSLCSIVVLRVFVFTGIYRNRNRIPHPKYRGMV